MIPTRTGEEQYVRTAGTFEEESWLSDSGTGFSVQTNTKIPPSCLINAAERAGLWLKKVSKKGLFIIYSVINNSLGIIKEW